MAFDQTTRNRLQRFVNDARGVLEEEFTRQLQNDYGMDPNSGTVADLASLRHINDAQRESARILRDTLAHYTASGDMNATQGLDRIVREQAFTVLNRLAALRMAEARGLLVESVGNGFQAKGFQLYARLAGTGLGETGDAYRAYLFSVFDELAQDLPGLFDRYSPQGRLFPREAALLQVLNQINDADIAPLWSEDETIGWIYQYFNSKEERKAMRDASQAPRNSRELAVRNQFFTPRYVVEFLVDNTLGRLWFNATGGATGLRERCQYLLVKPDETPQAATKLRDPRTLKLLDPACGSMHFGLYAFDLFTEIYREAWAWEQQHGPGSLDVSTQPQAALKPLSQTYEDEAAFLRDVPRLIIEHNIYGVDIDPRAAQIASLALWLRAQRAWHDAGVKAKDRPLIGHGHVVAAIAPPAERELREQLAANLDQRDAELFEKTLQLLKGLPDLGVLLQVERELPNLIRQVYVGKVTGLFAAQERESWQQAEARLRTALTEFAQAAKSTYQGRLFAQDALQGLRLIDLCREVFDVVVMNPPFGQPTRYALQVLKDRDSDGWKDIYAGFFEAALRLISDKGFVGAITSSQYFHTRQMAKLRDDFVAFGRPRIIVDLGPDVLDDAAVQTALAVLGGRREDADMFYADLFEAPNKEMEIRRILGARKMAQLSLKDLGAIPGKPFCLHASSRVLSQWRLDTTLDPHTATVATGNHTFDDERFLRLRHEVERIDDFDAWVAFEKGGEYQPFQSSTPLLLQWKRDGAELRELNVAAYGSDAQVMQSNKYWKRFGLCFTHVSSVGFSPRVLPSNVIFSSESISIFLNDCDDRDANQDYLALLGFMTSTAAQELVSVFGRYRKIENRAVSGMPISFRRLDQFAAEFANFAKRGISLCLKLESMDETSPHFQLPDRIAEACHPHLSRDLISRELADLYQLIDELADQCLGVSDSDLTAVRRASLVPQFSAFREIRSEKDRKADMLMWAVGVAFGRFDWRLAAGERQPPAEPDPFNPLPAKSPGMLPDGADPFHAHAGILVDDQGHPHDLARLIEEVLVRVEVPVPEDVRRWLHRDFFAFHLQRYSKSRRKAPIYWPLATASGSYTLWVYYPNLTSQTLYTAINDFVEPKLKQIGADVTVLRNKGSARTRDDEKQLETLQAFELELIELRDTLLKLAPTYKPNHDDGVQISAAPLWPLFRHKPWQKVLKDTWAKLEKGDYDWAHLAMNYWPERVREKCKTDKSLAIAHGLEDLYIEPEAAPKKTRGRKKAGSDE
ncbi:BREX-1 system adenine-specific DNA-methyltransferase PglX [Acidithiobacillus ferridurans]|uniref:BREX-1 system adenine-specific DNA-methyltransferase PglX n=1 Tax=Acidithiobacillus ferridurans TaxID=1232575 RepID=UPI001C0726E5|nr:BREX-1 system adenine-specific DNA-methyltransferase PglX [Acidithiobacillus ferridurans]MBU2731330.1 BREX-1 system adenine-specific DNA-methyltransferase PglX [Acidithiobacillus ferridurans]